MDNSKIGKRQGLECGFCGVPFEKKSLRSIDDSGDGLPVVLSDGIALPTRVGRVFFYGNGGIEAAREVFLEEASDSRTRGTFVASGAFLHVLGQRSLGHGASS